MKSITRKEYYLAKAAGTYTGPTPPPVLREDYYLATLAGDYSGYCPAPVTRLDMFMSAAAGLTSYVPQPITRLEMYWYNIAKGTGYVPEPVTREEKFLYAILKNPPKPEYLDKTAEGNPILLTDSAEAPLTALSLYGWSKQDGTPTPENPVPIVSAGSVMVESKNLWRNPKPNTLYGVTLSYEGDYVVLNGTCTAAANFQLSENTLFPGEYTISADVQGEVPNNSAPLVQVYSMLTGFNIPIPNNNISPVTGTLAEPITDAYFRVRIDAGFQYDNVKIRVMFNAGSTALPYEPYFTSYVDPDEDEINVTVQGGNLVDVLNPDNWVYNAEDGPYLSYKIPIPSGTYTISMSQNNMNRNYFTEHGINESIALYFGSTPSTASPNKMIGNSGSTSTTTTITTTVSGSVYLNLYFDSLKSFTREQLEYVFSFVPDFMLNYGSTALPYMPYKTPQTLTAQTPGGLPGIPVSSGGNYTDESGQQWICDEVDFKRGKYVQRVWKGTFDGSEDWRLYETNPYQGFLILDALPEVVNNLPGFCNQARLFDWNGSILDTIRFGASDKTIIMCNNSFRDNILPDYGLANWKAHLAAHPLEVMTYLETPIETDLSDEELAAYRALHTYSPTTTVGNDAEAWMKVGYKAIP